MMRKEARYSGPIRNIVLIGPKGLYIRRSFLPKDAPTAALPRELSNS